MKISRTFVKVFLILSLLFILLNFASLAFNFYTPYFGYALIGIGFIWVFLIFRKKEAGFWFELPKYIFLFLLLIITISSLKFDFINNILWLKSFIDFTKIHQLWLTIATVAIGVLVFFMNKDVVGNGIEKEKEDEERAEKRRYEEFDGRFPRLKWFDFDYGIKDSFSQGKWLRGIFRIFISPFVWIARLPYSLGKWMHGEGAWYVLGLILILGLYLFVQFSMFQYSGNYPDEYRHMLVGQSLLETGKFPVLNNSYGNQGYLYGIPLSYLVAFLFSIFGVSLFVAKLVPIFLGFITLILLNAIAKEIISNKIIRYILLLLFIFNSWLIFNHFYIRHYVFLEFSLIFLIYSMVKFNKNISNKSWKNWIYLCGIILINFINYFLMYDQTKYIIPFATFFGAVYLFLFESQNININQKHLKKLFHLNFLKKIFVIIVICVIILLFFSTFLNLNSLINSLLGGETNNPITHLDFNNLFFENYLFFTIYFLIGLFITFMTKGKSRLIYFMVLPLFILHYISNEYIQIMRVMVYLLPIYFLLVCAGLKSIIKNFYKNKFIVIFILLLFIISSTSILLQDKNIIFNNGYPQIPGEINYQEYKPTLDYINNNLSNYILITADYENLAGLFFNTNISYNIDFKNTLQNNYAYYRDSKDVLREYFTNISVIEKPKDFEDIISNYHVCILLRPLSIDFLRILDLQNIKNDFKKEKSFITFEIYCHDK